MVMQHLNVKSIPTFRFNIMAPHFRSITETAATVIVIILCGIISTTLVLAADEQLLCYQGTIQSNTKGQVPLGSDIQLSSLPCGSSLATVTTGVAPTTGAQPTTARMTEKTTRLPSPTQSPGPSPSPSRTPSPATTVLPDSPTTKSATTNSPSRRRRSISPTSYLCTFIKTFPGGSRLTRNTTWVANFTCLPKTECHINNPNKGFCCNTTNCNSLSRFQRVTETTWATVSSCLVGIENSTVSQFVSKKCPGASQYCFNRTIDDKTTFGCSDGMTQCTTGGVTDKCAKDSLFCCCASDDCNGPPRLPVMTTPYLVKASKHTSKWMIVLLIATGILVGGIAGVILIVVCRRWKRKRNHNGPLNISYSRVNADCTIEDDDNIFSY